MLEIVSDIKLQRPLILAAIQIQAALDHYASAAAFEQKVSSVLSQVADKAGKNTDVLVVFPEDFGLGLVLTEDYPAITSCQTLTEAGRRMLIRHAPSVTRIAYRYKIPIVRAILSDRSKFVRHTYTNVFPKLAKKYGFYIMAGSAPIPEGKCLFNQGYLFGPNGNLELTARKVQLVPLEEEMGLNLCRGQADALKCAHLPIGIVGIAICLDAFHEDIIASLAAQNVQILLQPSFNPLPWTKQQEKDWKTGLWQAVQRHKGIIGVNPMMVGGLLDVIGEGLSSIVIHKDLSPDASGYLARANCPTDEEILMVKLVPK